MDVKAMDDSEFRSKGIGDRVIFYKRPLEHPDSFPSFVELGEYTIIGKYKPDPRGPVLDVLEVLGDGRKPVAAHYSFFLSGGSLTGR